MSPISLVFLTSFDLSELRKNLEAGGIRKDLQDAIMRVSSVASIRRDLKTAEAALQLLVASVSGDAREGQNVLEAALLTEAVIVYCRATHTVGSGRWHVGITKAFDQTQKRAHNDIVDLRDQTIAHFGVGVGRHSARWKTEKVLLKFYDDRVGIGTSWGSINVDHSVISELSDLISVALRYVEQLRDERLEELWSLIRNALDYDPAFAVLLQPFVFDHKAFYGPGFEDQIEAFEEGREARTFKTQKEV